MGNKVKDLTGNKYGKLTVLHQIEGASKGSAVWCCLCECGNMAQVKASNLKNGNTKSCGCLKRTKRVDQRVANHPLYSAWAGARDRVINPLNSAWENYGGRGITMCQEWLNSFQAFVVDMYPTWQEGLTLDRIDVNGNYCKENCRWASYTTQMHNKRKERGCSSDYIGVYLIKSSGKFRGNIKVGDKLKHLGCFSIELDAATAYDDVSEQVYGDRPNKTTKEKHNAS